MKEETFQSTYTQEDVQFETPLRPCSLQDFIGQADVKNQLHILIDAAKQRGEGLGHCLFSGPPGLGKTTLANILSSAMGSNIVVTSGPAIEKAGDLAGILTKLQDGDFLFIDELHRLSRPIEEYLYPAIEDFVLDLMIDTGPNARSVQVKLNRFTLVGATTRLGLLTSALRSRFALTCRLDYYQPKELKTVVFRTAKLLNVDIDDEAALAIAERARGTPRVVNHLVRWVRDYWQTRASGKIDKEIVQKALSLLHIDSRGLDEMDRKILEVMINHYEGGPVGIKTLAVAVGEVADTIEEVHEPYLIKEGLIQRTSKGRVVTTSGFQHMGVKSL